MTATIAQQHRTSDAIRAALNDQIVSIQLHATAAYEDARIWSEIYFGARPSPDPLIVSEYSKHAATMHNSAAVRGAALSKCARLMMGWES